MPTKAKELSLLYEQTAKQATSSLANECTEKVPSDKNCLFLLEYKMEIKSDTLILSPF